MRSKKLVIGLLLLLAVVFTTGTFAYWASSVAGDDATTTGTITIGTGNQVTTTVSLGAAVNSQGSDALVPAGFAESGKIVSLTLSFDVDWASTGLDASGLTGGLAVTYDAAVNTTNSDDVKTLFNVSGLTGYTIDTDDATSTTVTITITMNEPSDLAEYELVAGEDVILTFTFTVTP
jgi:hypothetical protein